MLAVLLAAACSGAGGAGPGATSSPGTSPARSADTTVPPETTASIGASPQASPNPGATPAASPAAGVGWTELDAATDVPSPREDHTWTVDAAGATAYLFGGRAGREASNELWRYDLAADSWAPLQPAGTAPPARFGHVSVWVEGIGLVIWSGQAGSTFFSDIWAYDPGQNSWRELPAKGDVPQARYGSCGAVGPDGRLWVSHGFTEDTGRFSDTRAYDFETDTWTDMSVSERRPVIRCLHDCLWAPDGRFLLYAGQTTGLPAIGDLWAYRPADGTWAEAPEPLAPPRQLYALAQTDGRAYIFGGGGRDGGLLDDLWQLDLSSLGWSGLDPEGARPAGRSGATMVADPIRGRLLLFGGRTAAEVLNDLWQLPMGPG